MSKDPTAKVFSELHVPVRWVCRAGDDPAFSVISKEPCDPQRMTTIAPGNPSSSSHSELTSSLSPRWDRKRETETSLNEWKWIFPYTLQKKTVRSCHCFRHICIESEFPLCGKFALCLLQDQCRTGLSAMQGCRQSRQPAKKITPISPQRTENLLLWGKKEKKKVEERIRLQFKRL